MNKNNNHGIDQPVDNNDNNDNNDNTENDEIDQPVDETQVNFSHRYSNTNSNHSSNLTLREQHNS